MSKGIIKNNGGTGGTGGKLIVTEPGVGENVLPGDVIGFTDSAVAAGTAVTFVVSTTVAAGGIDTIAGGIDTSGPPTATSIAVDGTVKGKIITTNVTNSLSIGPGQAVLITGSLRIGDHVTVAGGILIITDGVTAGDKITGNKGATVIINNLTNSDSVITSGCKTVSICNSNINGVTSTSDGNVKICTNTIKDFLTVTTPAGLAQIGNNTVSGRQTLPPTYSPCS